MPKGWRELCKALTFTLTCSVFLKKYTCQPEFYTPHPELILHVQVVYFLISIILQGPLQASLENDLGAMCPDYGDATESIHPTLSDQGAHQVTIDDVLLQLHQRTPRAFEK